MVAFECDFVRIMFKFADRVVAAFQIFTRAFLRESLLIATGVMAIGAVLVAGAADGRRRTLTRGDRFDRLGGQRDAHGFETAVGRRSSIFVLSKYEIWTSRPSRGSMAFYQNCVPDLGENARC